MNRLSILICSIDKRKDFLSKLLDSINSQATSEGIETIDKTDIRTLQRIDYGYFEVIVYTDAKKITVGTKRNKLLRLANYEYTCFVDDDDRITPDYVETLTKAINTKIDNKFFDSIVFEVLYNPKVGSPMKAIYSYCYIDKTYSDHFKRATNHLMVIKKDIALKGTFPNTSFGEDANWAKQVVRHIKNEGVINRILYYYDFDFRNSETQNRRNR